MKIVLFDELPFKDKLGIVTEWKRLIDKDDLIFRTDRDGVLSVGQHTYKTVDGCAFVPQYHVLLGESHKISFTDDHGTTYTCGTIKRTGSRLIEITNDLETCLIACVSALDAQNGLIKTIMGEIEQIKKQYGVSVG